jgi:hypothetical protein
MIKRLFFTAALLAPGLAYAGTPSADLSGQIVPANQAVLPTPILMAWMVGAPLIPAMLTNAPQYNLISYSGATSFTNDGNLTLNLSTYGGNGAALITDIGTWHASTDKKGNHRKIILSIGDCFGGGSGTFLTATNATQAVNSIINIITTQGYPFDGIEWDLESGNDGNSGTCWNATTINSIDSQLRANYGSNFIITQTPRAFELGVGSVKRGWMATLDLSAIQYYFSINGGVWDCSLILARERGDDGEGMKQFVGGSDGGSTVAPQKILTGNFIGSGCTATQLSSAWSTINTTYPGLNAGVWQNNSEAASGYSYAAAFGPLL